MFKLECYVNEILRTLNFGTDPVRKRVVPWSAISKIVGEKQKN